MGVDPSPPAPGQGSTLPQVTPPHTSEVTHSPKCHRPTFSVSYLTNRSPLKKFYWFKWFHSMVPPNQPTPVQNGFPARKRVPHAQGLLLLSPFTGIYLFPRRDPSSIPHQPLLDLPGSLETLEGSPNRPPHLHRVLHSYKQNANRI